MVLSAVVLVLGVLLLILGIVTDKSGAVVVGLCVAAAGCARLIVMRRLTGPGNRGPGE